MSVPVRTQRWSGAHLVLALLVIGCRKGPPTDRYSEMPAVAASALDQADELELVLVDGQGSGEGKRIIIRDPAVRTRLSQALKKGVQDSHGWSKGCFHPRLYMLNATRAGKITKFRISFECWQVHMSDPDLDFSTSDSPQAAFDAVLNTNP